MTRILIVDTHEIVRRGLQAIIEQRSDWHVRGEAWNGREAVKLALKTAADVVVLDLFLPELNGVEVTRANIAKPSFPLEAQRKSPAGGWQEQRG